MQEEEVNEKDHPFPNEEFALIMKWNQEQKKDVEDVIMVSNLLHKYLNLRAYIFHNRY